MSYEKLKISVAHADGARLFMDDGSEFIDACTGAFGYQNPSVLNAVDGQIDRIALSSRSLISRPLADLVVRLNEITPASVSTSYICNSHDEAFDAALKLVKGYHRHRHQVIVVRGGDYGRSSYGLKYRYEQNTFLDVLPLQPIFVDETTENLSDKFGKNVAAIVFEPHLTGSQFQPLSPAFVQQLEAGARRCGALLVVCDHHFGLKRRGTWFGGLACEPDVLVYGRALGGGVLPVGAYTASKQIADVVYGRANPSLHGSTTGGNPLSCVAALAAIDELDRTLTVENVRQRHHILQAQLQSGSHNTASNGFHIEGDTAAIYFESSAKAKAAQQRARSQGLLVDCEEAELRFKPVAMISGADFQIAAQVLRSVLETNERQLEPSQQEEVA